jgi:hypothetical protein
MFQSRHPGDGVPMIETKKKPKKKRPSRKAQPREQAVLSVISVRISDEEKDRIDEIMRDGRFKSYSDMLRLAMQMYRIPNSETQQVRQYQ